MLFILFPQKLAFPQAWLASCESFCEIMKEFLFCLKNMFPFCFVFISQRSLFNWRRMVGGKGALFHPMSSWLGRCWKNVWQYLSYPIACNHAPATRNQYLNIAGKKAFDNTYHTSDCFPSCLSCPKSIQKAKGDLLVMFQHWPTFLALSLITKKKKRRKIETGSRWCVSPFVVVRLCFSKTSFGY